VHDCLTLEAAGKPAVVACNRRFATSGMATARMLGVPEYELVKLPKLLISATDSEIEAIVEDVEAKRDLFARLDRVSRRQEPVALADHAFQLLRAQLLLLWTAIRFPTRILDSLSRIVRAV